MTPDTHHHPQGQQRRTRHGRTVVAALSAAALAIPVAGTLAAAPATAASATAAPMTAGPMTAGPATLLGTAPDWVRGARAAAPAAAGTQLAVRVRLRVDEAGATAFATAVSKPGSALRGHFLTPDQWRDRFGAPAAEVSRVAAFLRAQGFTAVRPNSSRTAVSATVRVGVAERVFGVRLARYRVGKQLLRAPDRNLRLPAAVAADIAGITGLTQLPAKASPVSAATLPASSRRAAASPSGTSYPIYSSACSAYFGQHQVGNLPKIFGVTALTTPICNGYTPKRVESAYGLTSLLAAGTTGAGVTVAIIGAFRLPTMASDADRYSANHLLPTFAAGQFTENLPAAFDTSSYDSCGGLDNWNGEEALDVEAAHTTAPGADILYIAGSDCGTGLVEAFDRLLGGDGHAPLATIVSNSNGYPTEILPAADIAAQNAQDIQAAAEGVTVLFSSGDSGDNASQNNGLAQPSFPASSPWVTAVGGTTLGISKRGARIFETGWEDSVNVIAKAGPTARPGYLFPLPGLTYFGGGGGTSTVFGEPAYQVGVVPTTLALARGTGTAGRVVPDVAMLGDPLTGFAMGYSALDPASGTRSYLEESLGGTSLSSPLLAGVIALAQQSTHRPFGFLNPTLYQLRSGAAFRDLRAPNPLSVPSRLGMAYGSDDFGATEVYGFNSASSLVTAPGFDGVTGLGSPDGTRFITALSQALS